MIKSYGQVINETLSEEMEKDSSIFLFGEDIGEYGGCFGITKGLYNKFGSKRVIDSPMSEQSIIGLGIGAALNGLKPVVEIMFMDFMTLAYDQIFNHASTFNYLSGGQTPVPILIRVSAGGGRGYGTTHSKTLIAPYMNIPGIKIVTPSNAREVRGLLRASMQDKNPVIFVENKLLYSLKEEVENSLDYIPLGKANVVKSGKDLLVVTFSKAVNDCLEIANRLEKEGKSVEVIDLRTIKPLDMETIRNSLERIGKILIVEEGYYESGVAAEIIARVNESCFEFLKAAPRRICTIDVPISCCPVYENCTIPSIKRIEEEIRRMLQ